MENNRSIHALLSHFYGCPSNCPLKLRVIAPLRLKLRVIAPLRLKLRVIACATMLCVAVLCDWVAGHAVWRRSGTLPAGLAIGSGIPYHATPHAVSYQAPPCPRIGWCNSWRYFAVQRHST